MRASTAHLFLARCRWLAALALCFLLVPGFTAGATLNKVYYSPTSLTLPLSACDPLCSNPLLPCKPTLLPLTLSSCACNIIIQPGDWSGIPLSFSLGLLPTAGELVITGSTTTGPVENLSVSANLGALCSMRVVNLTAPTHASFSVSIASPFTIENSNISLEVKANGAGKPPAGLVADFSGTAPGVLNIVNSTLSLTRNGLSNIVAMSLATTNSLVVSNSSLLFSGARWTADTISKLYVSRSSINTLSLPTASNTLSIQNCNISGLNTSFNAGSYGDVTIQNSIISAASGGILNLFSSANASVNTLTIQASQFVNASVASDGLKVMNTINVANSQFRDSPLSLVPSQAASAVVSNCHFLQVSSPIAALSLQSLGVGNIGTDISLLGNSFASPASPTPSGSLCPLQLANVGISSESSISVDHLCVGANTTIKGALNVQKSIEGVAGNSSLLSSVSTSPNWVFDAITYSTSMVLPNLLVYHVTNATSSLGIRALGLGLSLDFAGSGGLGISLGLDFEPPLGSSIPLISGSIHNLLTPVVVIPVPGLNFSFSTNGSSPASLGLTFDTVATVPIPCPQGCNTSNAHSCSSTGKCNCLPGWGPEGDCSYSTESCGGLSVPTYTSTNNPFLCVDGQWTSTSGTGGVDLVIPAGSGDIVINGSFNVTGSLVFGGLGSHLFVNGCISIPDIVQLHLSDTEIEQLLKQAAVTHIPLITLLEAALDNRCHSTDLSTVTMQLNSAHRCMKTSGFAEAGPQTLLALINVNNSGCNQSSKNKLLVIAIPSALGAAAFVAIVLGYIGWKQHRAAKLKAMQSVQKALGGGPLTI